MERERYCAKYTRLNSSEDKIVKIRLPQQQQQMQQELNQQVQQQQQQQQQQADAQYIEGLKQQQQQ